MFIGCYFQVIIKVYGFFVSKLYFSKFSCDFKIDVIFFLNFRYNKRRKFYIDKYCYFQIIGVVEIRVRQFKVLDVFGVIYECMILFKYFLENVNCV